MYIIKNVKKQRIKLGIKIPLFDGHLVNGKRKCFKFKEKIKAVGVVLHVKCKYIDIYIYSKTSLLRPPKGMNQSGLNNEVVIR